MSLLTKWCKYTIFGFASDYVFHCQYYFVFYYFPVLFCFILNIKVFDVRIVPLISSCLTLFFEKTKRFSTLALFPLFDPALMCILFSLYLSVLLSFPVVIIICVVAMSRKENLISDLHTRKRTWKIVVRITDLWQARKKNSKQAIEMVFMDQTVIVVLFLFVVITHLYCMWCHFILWFKCFRVQKLGLLSGKSCSLICGTSYIVVLRIWFRTWGLLTTNLNTESA